MGARGLEAAVELAPGEARGAGASGPGEGPGPMTGGPGRALRVEGRGRDRAWGALRVEGGDTGPGGPVTVWGEEAVEILVLYNMSGSSWRAGQDASLSPLEVGSSL